MKSLLINPYSQQQEWCKDYFPDRSLGMMPIAGRCAAEYFIDLALRCKAQSLLLLGPTYNEHLAEHLYEYQHGELSLDYRKGGGHDTVSHLLEIYKNECQDDCLILHGMLMPKAYTLEELQDSFVPCEDDGADDGIYYFKAGKLLKSNIEFYHINSLQSYFEVNFQVLNDDFYNLPGYSITDNVHTGTNVVMKNDCSLAGPLVLGDNTFVESGSVISDAIIGERSLVDKACIIKHSIIFDRTYAAGNLEIKNKIVTPGRIIDPYSGGVLERNSFSYAFSPVQNRSAWILRLWEHFIALILALLFAVPYLLILPFYLMHKKSHWCWKLSMDRYPGYWAVLFFRKELVKSHPANEHYVFQMGEIYGLQNTPEQRRIYDYYYHYHCSCFLVLQVVLRSLGKRGFATYGERKRS
jgi:acetyltransferase-like isoleucine patch superfamily enzyme